MLNAIRARRPRSDGGLTLVELLVVMVLASIVGLMTLLAFNGASKASSTTGDRLAGTASARVTLQSWQSLVQTAASAPTSTTECAADTSGHRFEWIDSTDMLLYTNAGNLAQDGSGDCTAAQLVWLAERNGTLLEAHYVFSTPAGSTGRWTLGVCRTLTLGPNASVDMMATPQLFTAFTRGDVSLLPTEPTLAGGDPFATTTSCATVPAVFSADAVSNTDTDTNTDLANVNAVGITFTVTDRTATHSQAFRARAAVYGGSS